VRQAAAAVGLITVRKTAGQPSELRARGSAVVVGSDGIIVTSYHVIVEDKSDRLYDEIYFNLPPEAGSSPQSASPHRLEVLLLNKTDDLALLRVKSAGNHPPPFAAMEIGDSRAVKLLDDIIIIGYPEKGGSTVTVNTGVVEGIDALGSWIKTSARLIHGNSGGAAVSSEGKLIGIPTKVVADRQPVDGDGDGFPDDYQWLGAVGFLRPAHLVASMLSRARPTEDGKNAVAQTAQATPQVIIEGIVKSAADGRPVAGARIGITLLGSREVTPANLLTWGGSNGEGLFKLDRPVPAGRYTLKAKAISYEPFSLDVEIDPKKTRFAIQLRPSR
jgi:S1-C subfamily serine protease